MHIVKSGDDAFIHHKYMFLYSDLLATECFGSMNITCIFDNGIKQEALCNMLVCCILFVSSENIFSELFLFYLLHVH